eukprot:Opistho-2@90583
MASPEETPQPQNPSPSGSSTSVASGAPAVRGWFDLQMQIMRQMLDYESDRLKSLQRQMEEVYSAPESLEKSYTRQEKNLERVKQQYDQLRREVQELSEVRITRQRSLPTLGLDKTPKKRVSMMTLVRACSDPAMNQRGSARAVFDADGCTVEGAEEGEGADGDPPTASPQTRRTFSAIGDGHEPTAVTGPRSVTTDVSAQSPSAASSSSAARANRQMVRSASTPMPGDGDVSDDDTLLNARGSETPTSGLTTPEMRSPRTSPKIARARSPIPMATAGTTRTDALSEIAYHADRIVSGPLDALIQKLTPSMEYYPDTKYMFTFLLTFRIYTTGVELMEKIFESFIALTKRTVEEGATHPNPNPPMPSSPAASMRSTTNLTAASKVNVVTLRFLNLLKKWIETFSYDFRDDKMMARLENMFKACLEVDTGFADVVQQLRTSLTTRLRALEEEERRHQALEAAREDGRGSGPGKVNKMISVMDITSDTNELSKQMLIIDIERFKAISPEEFVQTLPTKEGVPDIVKTLSNLGAYVQWFNRMSYWVATEIVGQASLKDRVTLIERFVKVAKNCKRLHNYNALMGIVAGLNMSPVQRLKKTWTLCSNKTTSDLRDLELAMSPAGNFKNYRDILSVPDADAKPGSFCCVPFFSLMVKDLYFTVDANPNRLPNGHVNFEKLWQLSDRVTMIMRFQQSHCAFEPNTAVKQYVETARVLDEKSLYEASKKLE